MLDTDIASYIIRGDHPGLDRHVASVPPADVCISSITRAELLYGVHRKPGATHLARVVVQFLGTVQSLAWDDDAADRFAKLAADLDANGERIGTFDTMLAAHALATDRVMVTNNLEHFSRVSGLAIENWAASY